MERLHAFSQYVQLFYDQGEATLTHKLMSVPDVGHSGCGMFQSAQFAAAALTRSTPNTQTVEAKAAKAAKAAGSAVQTIPAPAALLLASHRSRTKSVDYTYSCMPASTSDLSACDDADPLDGQRTNSGGHVLMGGSTDVDAAFKWQVGEELVSCSSA